ncbi:E3 ubiquitin-protein ligase TRIM39-like [Hyperolius riggenbachi]|uniref:E3 ubiquitin-protein ligase TRIM39-like n=1 Tax=Hyperolius riggenbachi TaxID=752182 RepID=UPI0035A2AA32
MASADLRKELECPVCRKIYTDPVSLRCGHNFCRGCISRLLDIKLECGVYTCPECREEFQERPELQRNVTLTNMLHKLQQKEIGVRCTYCLDFPVSAVKSCLLCDASMCEKHLTVHSKAPEHVLCAPTTSLETRRCSVHKKILEYYCTEDSACICVSCSLAGDHRGHQVETLQEASEKKKKKLRDGLQKWMTEIEEVEKKAQENRRKAHEKSYSETERVSALFTELRKRLENLEKKVLRDITEQTMEISGKYNEVIRQLEIKKAELSRKMRHIEELYPKAYPQSSTPGKIYGLFKPHPKSTPTSLNSSHQSASANTETLQELLEQSLYADVLLDENTAGKKLSISDDRKTASRSLQSPKQPETAERFDCPQVMSTQSFSSGRHYWEVDVSRSRSWIVGVCYSSIDRKGSKSEIGSNKKSWGLDRDGDTYTAVRDEKTFPCLAKISSKKIRMYLDYEAGHISFFDPCDQMRHLATITATFTEPLHAALYIGKGSIKISEGESGVRNPPRDW